MTVSAWPPTRYSAPVGPVDEYGLPVHSRGHSLVKVVEAGYRLPDGRLIVLDFWQRALVIWALETYPPGHRRAGQLVRRQLVISVGRQNGKSVLGAIFVIFGLLRAGGQLVIGIASSADQANIVFKRVRTALTSNPAMAKRFTKLTETRGLKSADNSEYLVKASKSAAVQGLDVNLGIVDELHLTKPELWTDLVNGTRAQGNGLVVGITTAGDESSALLLHLYALAEVDDNERFGYAIWEAPADLTEKDVQDADDATFAGWLTAANPALAAGRLDLETVLADVRAQPLPDQMRYALNIFVKGGSKFLALSRWREMRTDEFPEWSRPVFAFTVSDAKDWCTVVAAQVVDGVTYTRTVAQLPTGDLAKIVKFAEGLWAFDPARFVVERSGLGGLAEVLTKRAYPVTVAGAGDRKQASRHLFALVAQDRLRHDGDRDMLLQVARAQRKNIGAEWQIDTELGEVDSLYALAYAALYAEIAAEESLPQMAA